MGSYAWDNRRYLQYHNGRPLSIALTEPCGCNGAPFVDSPFSPHHPSRSHSSGRRYKRESYNIYHPNGRYPLYGFTPLSSGCFSDQNSSGNVLVENFETMTIEEPPRLSHHKVVHHRTPSPRIRQIKIRSRPSSCFDLNQQKVTDNQNGQYVDEIHEQNYQYHYDYTLPIQFNISSNINRHDATTATDDLYVPLPPPRPSRPITRDIGVNANLPKRPLSVSETQILDRYETEARIQRASTIETASYGYLTPAPQPLPRSFNGTRLTTNNSFSIYSDNENDNLIIRPTAKPREAIVDSPAILVPSNDSNALTSSSSTTTTTTTQRFAVENDSSSRTRNYFPFT